MKKNKTIKLVIITAIVLLLVILGPKLGTILSLENLKGSRDGLLAYVDQNFLKAASLFFLAYVAVTALSLPGAAIMTLAAGAIFGLVRGVVLVSFASTIGATLAFLIARFLFAEVFQQKFGDKLERINRGVEKEGAFYLFTLRLVPAFPFFIINVLMALTTIKTWTFYWVSQLGMLAGTIAYVNAGTELAKIDSLSEIVSPGLIAAFVILGLLPLLSKRLIDYLRSKKVLAKYDRPDSFDYNLVAIGAGSAGLVTTYIGAAVKARVALIERHKMGGDCLNTGCVPSKALIRSAKILSYIKRSKEFGFDSADVEYNFANVMERVQRVIKKVEPHDSVERYTSLGVDCIIGEAKIKSPYEIEVNGKTITSKNIVIATGARPFIPDLPGIEQMDYLTSDTIWDIREQPKRLLVLGGGPIGSELTQCFQRLGSQVIQVEKNETILAREDKDVSEFVLNKFLKEGVDVRCKTRAARFELKDGKKIAYCISDQGEVAIEFDTLLVALGRRANVSGFGLEELGINLSERGTIEANEFLQTNIPNIYVCGDVTGPYQFTHSSAHQAWFAAVNSLFGSFKKFRVDYRVLPWTTFTDPEVAHVGLSERAAKAKGIDYQVIKYGLDDLDRAIADEEDHGFVKVITPKGKDKILGVTIVGTHAGDLLAEFVLAMKHKLGLNKILGTIHTYPTLAEANKYVAGEWKKANQPEKLLSWIQRYHSWQRGR